MELLMGLGNKFEPIDAVAVLIIILCFIYMFICLFLNIKEANGVVSGILLTITGFYFGRKTIKNDDKSD